MSWCSCHRCRSDPQLKDTDVDEYVTKKNIKPGNAIKTSGTAAATWELKDLYAVEVDNKTDAFAVDASGNRINDKSTNVLDIATSVASNNQVRRMFCLYMVRAAAVTLAATRMQVLIP